MAAIMFHKCISKTTFVYESVDGGYCGGNKNVQGSLCPQGADEDVWV
jgi:hypothetical protein